MKIEIRNPDEFRRLLTALINELIDANDHLRLYKALQDALNEYQQEFNEANSFWTLTFQAHADAVAFRLCKAYDQYDSGRPL